MVSLVEIPIDELNSFRMAIRCPGSYGRPSDARKTFILVAVVPSMQVSVDWSFKYARYSLMFS